MAPCASRLSLRVRNSRARRAVLTVRDALCLCDIARPCSEYDMELDLGRQVVAWRRHRLAAGGDRRLARGSAVDEFVRHSDKPEVGDVGARRQTNWQALRWAAR